MTLTTHTIKKAKGSSKRKVRVGRGNASGKGTYSARGLKGQRSRSGGSSGLKLRGFKQTLQRIPKKRGFKSGKIKPEVVTLKELDSIFKDGDTVTPNKLKKRGLVTKTKHGVKIIGTGDIAKKITVSGCLTTSGAKEKITQAGGTLL